MNAGAVLLLGPTACGKSELALGLARDLAPGQALEIVSIDSAQVYRGLDIGSAKPSADACARVPHHLVDIRDPAQPYSAADFLRDATAAIADINQRGGQALVVGGTMMYARVLREGLAQLPSADPALRARLQAQASRDGWPALHARLAQVDPATAARLAPADRQRIGRALEVLESSGQRLSALLAQTPPPLPGLRTIALMPADRALLHQRIAQRFDAMLAAGLLDEVRTLRARADLHAQLPALRSVGYRQAWEHLERGTAPEDFRQAAIAATRQLAKRQMTWLRSMRDAQCLDPFDAQTPERLLQLLRAPAP